MPARPRVGHLCASPARSGITRRDAAGPTAAVALVLAGCLCLSGCGLLLGVPVELALALAEERSMDDAIDDLAIRLALNHVFLREHGEL